MCVLIFSTTFVSNISHCKKNWARYDKKKYIGLHVKQPLFLSDFNETWIFSTDFWRNTKKSYFVETHPVGAELFHADGQTDKMKLIVAFHNFADTPKNVTQCFMIYSLSSLLSLRIKAGYKFQTSYYFTGVTFFILTVHKILLYLADFVYKYQSNITNCQRQFLTYNIHCGWKEFQK